MPFRFHRSLKVLPGIRLNFGKRGISTSIGVRGAHVTFGRTGTRATVGLPGTGLSYTHLERPHRTVPAAKALQPPTDPYASQRPAPRGFFWIALILAVLLAALGRLATPAPPDSNPTEARTQPAITAQTAAQTISDDRLAEIKAAAVGLTQIRHTVANSNTLTLSRVTAMPNGTICYQFHLRNRRGVTYTRTAMTQGADLKVSGSDGYAPQWSRRCAMKADGRDITAKVEASVVP